MESHPNIPELAGTFPVVLYFATQADADEFIALMRDAKPGLVSRSLPVLETGRDATKELMPDGPVDMQKVEEQEAEMHRQQRESFERRRGNDQY